MIWYWRKFEQNLLCGVVETKVNFNLGYVLYSGAQFRYKLVIGLLITGKLWYFMLEIFWNVESIVFVTDKN